jgi:Zinc finger, C3HC4 type (RING finger)
MGKKSKNSNKVHRKFDKDKRNRREAATATVVRATHAGSPKAAANGVQPNPIEVKIAKASGKKVIAFAVGEHQSIADDHVPTFYTYSAKPVCPRPELSKDELLRLARLVSDKLLDAVLSRGCHLTDKESLRQYFVDLLLEKKFHYFTLPILRGLTEGFSAANEKLSSSPVGAFQGTPLLMIAATWKSLRTRGFWPAKSEIVDMILKAGAYVDATDEFGQTALIQACLTGDHYTVAILLTAGADTQHSDQKKSICFDTWFYCPEPDVLKRVLLSNPTLAHSLGRTPIMDRVLHPFFFASNSIGGWDDLGPPSFASIMESLRILQLFGCSFSPKSQKYLQAMGSLFRVDSGMLPAFCHQPGLCKNVAKALFGELIPENLRPTKTTLEEANERAALLSDMCGLCSKKASKPITLYCKHTFCRNCIMEHSKSNGWCPDCFQTLAYDIRQRCALVNYPIDDEPYSSLEMNDDQILREASFRGLVNSALDPLHVVKERLIEDERKELENSQGGWGMDHLLPSGGHPCIEISTRGVPLLAYIGNRSSSTMVPRSVVDQLRLSRTDDIKTTTNFARAEDGIDVEGFTFTVLEPFEICLGTIKVLLRDAIEIDPDPAPLYGMRLGRDALNFALYCAIDMMMVPRDSLEVPRLWRMVNNYSCPVERETSEMLRFYSWDGETAHLPIFHMNPWNIDLMKDDLLIKNSDLFRLCDWCCRHFPARLMECAACHEFGRMSEYCSKRCQVAAWRTHRKTRCGRYFPAKTTQEDSVASDIDKRQAESLDFA